MSGSAVRRFSALAGSIPSTRLARDLNAYDFTKGAVGTRESSQDQIMDNDGRNWKSNRPLDVLRGPVLCLNYA